MQPELHAFPTSEKLVNSIAGRIVVTPHGMGNISPLQMANATLAGDHIQDGVRRSGLSCLGGPPKRNEPFAGDNQASAKSLRSCIGTT